MCESEVRVTFGGINRVFHFAVVTSSHGDGVRSPPPPPRRRHDGADVEWKQNAKFVQQRSEFRHEYGDNPRGVTLRVDLRSRTELDRPLRPPLQPAPRLRDGRRHRHAPRRHRAEEKRITPNSGGRVRVGVGSRDPRNGLPHLPGRFHHRRENQSFAQM